MYILKYKTDIYFKSLISTLYLSDKTVDVFIYFKDGTLAFIDITSPKPNIKEFKELKRKLTLTLSNELILHPSIEKNIGYYWNQKLNEDSSNLFLIQGKEESYWVGSTYLLWTTDSRKKNQRYATWLYNDTQGNIIFEVTPTYPDTFIDPEDPADLKAYQEWMEKKYKPFFTRTIPRDVGIQWLDQANLILQTISDNVKMLEEKYKNENEE